MIRLAGSRAAARLLGFKTPFNEDDLYLNGTWLMERQAKVEAKLWQWRQADPLLSPTPAPTPDADPTRPPGLFFYDVTSSYFGM